MPEPKDLVISKDRNGKDCFEKAIDIKMKHNEFLGKFLQYTYNVIIIFVSALIVALIGSSEFILSQINIINIYAFLSIIGLAILVIGITFDLKRRNHQKNMNDYSNKLLNELYDGKITFKKHDQNLIPSQKEKNIFFAGAMVGLAGGVIGKLFISSLFELIEYSNISPYINLFLLIVSGLVFLGIIIWFGKKIKPVQKIKLK